MSDRQCNYCQLKRWREENKGSGIRLYVKQENFGLGGVGIYKVPKGEKLDASKGSKQHIAWFMELPDHCCC